MEEKTISRSTVYEGLILHVDMLNVELENGKRAKREIVQHGPAVAIIAQMPDKRFVFINQFRKAMERICFEVVAGNCDPGEDPKDTAIRELKEETGCVAGSISFLGSIYPCMGYCTERIDVFFANVCKRGNPCFDDDERIETLFVCEDALNAMIREGKIKDSKTLAAWMLYTSTKDS